MKSITPTHIAAAVLTCAAIALGELRLDGSHFALLLGVLGFVVLAAAWAATVEQSVTNLARRNHASAAATCVAHACACCATVDAA